MQNPQGNPLSISHPPQLAQPHLKPAESPPAEGPHFSRAALPSNTCACAFSPAVPHCQFGEGFFFPLGFFVSFENTPCLCCSFSAAQCTSPFPRPGARASVRSLRSEVAGVAGHPRASGTDKVSSAANVSRGNGALKVHPLETIYKALSPL